MDIQQESVQEFVVGHGGADAAEQAAWLPPATPRRRTRACACGRQRRNTIAVYVGPAGVTTESGYLLPAGEELEVKIERPVPDSCRRRAGGQL